MRHLRVLIRRYLWPGLTLGLLLAMAYSQSKQPRREQFDEFHATAKTALDSVPLYFGHYLGKEEPLQEVDLQLLKPNAVRNVRYTDLRAMNLPSWGGVVLTVVQCRRIEDMIGHYPPVCYPAFGDEQLSAVPREWKVGDQTIAGVEYRFEGVKQPGQRYVRIVYNFMVAPGKGFVQDMEGLKRINNELDRRFYGAAQFQVLFSGPPGFEPDRTQRDAVFADVIGQAHNAITVLMTDQTGRTTSTAGRNPNQGSNQATITALDGTDR